MFAFALWDARRRGSLLARDRVGKKPLYYTDDGERIAFASELKALLQDPALKRAVDPEAARRVPLLGRGAGAATIFQGVAQLRPAHSLVWENGTARIARVLGRAARVLLARSRGREPPGRFDEVFSEAVRLRLISDVPLGAFLSGGVDSTAVVEAMSRLLRRAPCVTTSVGFAERRFSELPHARAVARASRHRPPRADGRAPSGRGAPDDWCGTSTSPSPTPRPCPRTTSPRRPASG